MDDDLESYILLLLSDGNLPTGSFVASSGLESYETHGLMRAAISSAIVSQSSDDSFSLAAAPARIQGIIAFIRDSVQSYAHSNLPFIAAVYDICTVASEARSPPDDSWEEISSNALRRVEQLDELYEATTLNHVARRASTAQGVALLTLLLRGLLHPSWLPTGHEAADGGLKSPSALGRFDFHKTLAEALKTKIRKGNSSGNLPICWAILTSALGLSRTRSQHLFLFLQARSLLSASIRLNSIGPYAAQQILLHVVRPLIAAVMAECSELRVDSVKDSAECSLSHGLDSDESDHHGGPAVTWPLGEILAARHDLQHSRIFNS